MGKSVAKPSLGTRTLDFGSSFAAGAMMLSRMNRSELSRFDDLVADLCCLRVSGLRSEDAVESQLAARRRWLRQSARRDNSKG
ncbi:hypothetical protein [Kaistia adipata]|uniref:hypothetical protein n=1 Tax=Kaistia adipata TaxID=166954 RepID=UPI0003FAEA08|nr:hypothetical protein [Kaistia adipata]